MYCLERESKHVSLLYSEIEGRKPKMIQQTLEQKITINLSDITVRLKLGKLKTGSESYE